MGFTWLLSLSLDVFMLSRRLRSPFSEVKDVGQLIMVGSVRERRQGSALLGVRLGTEIPAACKTSCIGACPFVVCIRCAYVQVNLGGKNVSINGKRTERFVRIALTQVQK